MCALSSGEDRLCGLARQGRYFYAGLRDLLALVQDMGSIPIRCYSEEAVNVGLCQWGWEKAQLALMRLGVAAGDRTFVETVNQSLIITL